MRERASSQLLLLPPLAGNPIDRHPDYHHLFPTPRSQSKKRSVSMRGYQGGNVRAKLTGGVSENDSSLSACIMSLNKSVDLQNENAYLARMWKC